MQLIPSNGKLARSQQLSCANLAAAVAVPGVIVANERINSMESPKGARTLNCSQAHTWYVENIL